MGEKKKAKSIYPEEWHIIIRKNRNENVSVLKFSALLYIRRCATVVGDGDEHER